MYSIESERNNPCPPNLLILGKVPEECAQFDIADERVRNALFESQKHHFWFSSRNAFIVSMMKRIGLIPPARVLDVGCGTGTVLTHLIKNGYRVDGIEMHRVLSIRAAKSCPEATIYCLEVIRDGLETLDTQYDGIGLFDVLEHTEDPPLFLRAVCGAFNSDGIVFGTVPALTSLWSTMDDVSGHQRRYDRKGLSRDLKSAGLEPIVVAYFFHSLVPSVWFHRRRFRVSPIEEMVDRAGVISRCLAPPPYAVNHIFRAVCCVENVLQRCLPFIGNLPGASLFFAARKCVT